MAAIIPMKVAKKRQRYEKIGFNPFLTKSCLGNCVRLNIETTEIIKISAFFASR